MIGDETLKFYYEKLKHDDDTFRHILRVRELCKRFIDSGISVNEVLLMDAAGLHDIGKKLNKDDHHHEIYVNEALGSFDINRDKLKDICKIIKEHKGKFHPSAFKLEAAILRICDKLDKFTKAEIKAEKAYDKKMNKANKKDWSEKKAEVKAEKKYDEVYKETIEEASKSCKESMEKIEESLKADPERLSQFKSIYYKLLIQFLLNIIASNVKLNLVY